MKRYYIFPLIYTLITLVLIANRMVESSKSSFAWGNMTLEVSASDAENKRELKGLRTLSDEIEIDRASIRFPEVKFNFTSHSNIVNGNKVSTLSKVAPLPSGEGFVLYFGEEVFISFQTNLLEENNFAIIVHSKIDTLIEIPMSINWGISTEFKKDSFYIYSPRARMKVINSPSTEIRKTNHEWVLSGEGTYSAFQFLNDESDDIPFLSKVPIFPPTVVDDTQEVLDTYLDKSYRGLISTRFNPSLGTWSYPEGFSSFSEMALIMAYTESINRETLPKYKIQLDKVMAQKKNFLSWKSSFLGQSTPNQFDSFFEDAIQVKNDVLFRVSKNDRTVLNSPEIWDSIPFWKSRSQQQDFLRFISSQEAIYFTPENSAMLLYQSQFSAWDEFLEYISANRETLVQNIVSHIIRVNEGFMLINGAKQIDVFYTLVAANYLSQSAQDKNLQRLGYRMIRTVLQLSDENGYLPEIYVYKKDFPVPFGFITPEDIFEYITNNKYYPKIRILEGSDFFIYASPTIEINMHDRAITLDISFETNGTTFYSYLWNMNPPASILAFDLYWTGKEISDNFTKGISYNPALTLLTIKTLNRSNSEEIRIVF